MLGILGSRKLGITSWKICLLHAGLFSAYADTIFICFPEIEHTTETSLPLQSFDDDTIDNPGEFLNMIAAFCLLEVRAMEVAVQQPSAECTAIFNMCIV